LGRAAAAAATAIAAAAAAAATAAAAMPGRATAVPTAGWGAGSLGAGPGQEVVQEGRVASGSLHRLFGQLADAPVGDPGLAGKGNPFRGGQNALNRPESLVGGQVATQDGRCAKGLFRAGDGRGQRLVSVAARIGGCSVA
jgi:hypothetical protein